MKRWLPLVSCLCVSLLPANLAAQPRTAGPAMSADAAAGKRIFDAQCAWCHGAGGEGGTGPNLHGTLRHATTHASLVDIVIAGIPGTDMPSFRLGLTERAARQAASYVQSLSRASGRPMPGNAARGAALYESSRCGSCHLVRGRGNALGPDLTHIGSMRGAPYLRESLVKPEASHPPGYLVVRAVPASGPEVRGIRVNEDVFWIHIRDTGGTVHTLKKADLSSVVREIDASLMPSYARLSASELDDLVAHLSGLRGAQ